MAHQSDFPQMSPAKSRIAVETAAGCRQSRAMRVQTIPTTRFEFPMPYGLPSSFRAIAILTLLAMVGAPVARAETLTIQGSSTASTTLLAPNQATIEALSRQSLKIVGIRSDLGVLRLLARQAEFAVISSSLKQVVDSLRTNSPDLPYDKLAAFPVSQVRVAFAVNPNNPVRTADMASIRRVLSGELTNWKQLGGADELIRVAYMQPGGGVTLSVAGELFGGQPFTPANPIRVAFGVQVVRIVEQEPRA